MNFVTETTGEIIDEHLAEMLQKMIQAELQTFTLPPHPLRRSAWTASCGPLIGPADAADTKRLAYSVMTDGQKHQFEEKWEIDFSFGIKDLCRFRANVFTQRGSVGAVFRLIPFEIKGFESPEPAAGGRDSSAKSPEVLFWSPGPPAAANRPRWPP